MVKHPKKVSWVAGIVYGAWALTAAIAHGGFQDEPITFAILSAVTATVVGIFVLLGLKLASLVRHAPPEEDPLIAKATVGGAGLGVAVAFFWAVEPLAAKPALSLRHFEGAVRAVAYYLPATMVVCGYMGRLWARAMRRLF